MTRPKPKNVLGLLKQLFTETITENGGGYLRRHRPIVFPVGIDGGGTHIYDGYTWACPDCDPSIRCDYYYCILHGLVGSSNKSKYAHAHCSPHDTYEQVMDAARAHAQTQWVRITPQKTGEQEK